MFEGNVDLRYVVRRYRLRRASADQSQFAQVAVPGVLYHTQRKTSVGEQLGDRATGEHRPVGQHLVNVLGQGLRQQRLTVVQPQQLTPQILWPGNQVGAYPVDVRQHKFFGGSFTHRLSRVARLHLEQRRQDLTTQLPQHRIAELWKQLCERETDLARLA